MASAQGQRVRRLCVALWGLGEGDYDFDEETDDWENYVVSVRKDFLDSLGPPLLMTPCCDSPAAAWNELERMLSLLAASKSLGRPMTLEERCEVFGGPNGQLKPVLRAVAQEMAAREQPASTAKQQRPRHHKST